MYVDFAKIMLIFKYTLEWTIWKIVNNISEYQSTFTKLI